MNEYIHIQYSVQLDIHMHIGLKHIHNNDYHYKDIDNIFIVIL